MEGQRFAAEDKGLPHCSHSNFTVSRVTSVQDRVLRAPTPPNSSNQHLSRLPLAQPRYMT